MKRQDCQIAELNPTPEFVSGQGPAMQRVNAVIADIARTDIPVLLVGESGTGKEAYARLIHRLSSNPSAPMKKLKCAAISEREFREQILETNQLDHQNGESGCGTLFLDEIDELDLGCQRVLLSILPDDGEPKNAAAEFSGRLICATSRDLQQAIAAGQFRRELYFRINGVCLRLPPLRERKEDIPALLDCFLAKHAAQLQRPSPPVDAGSLELLMAHDWPGNIREFENMAKKIVALGDAERALGDLRAAPVRLPGIAGASRVSSLKAAARAASRRTEKELILKALERTHWNRKRAALELQISYKSLLYKLKQIGIPNADSTENY